MKRLERRDNMGKRGTNKKIRESESKKAEEISPEQYFVMCNGTSIKSIHELAMMLDNMSDDDFNFHVTEEKNDFSSWIRNVFGDAELADKLDALKCKKENQIHLLKHVVAER
jgi:hypothetical protein